MLTYFFNHSYIDSVKEIVQYLDRIKKDIIEETYKECIEQVNYPTEAFKKVINIAKEIDDESLANSAYVFGEYINLWLAFGRYFSLLYEHNFSKSWNTLQDCFDYIKTVGRYSDNKYDLIEVRTLLEKYENLYPYNVFMSSEYVISKSHCSICGKSMQSLECIHRRGELYWGEPATEIVDKVEKIQAMCAVMHPEDKRCVLTAVDDGKKEEDKFAELNSFINLGISPLTRFEIRKVVYKKKRYPKTYRNELCPCGSGKKYKFCCGISPYDEHVSYVVEKEGQLELAFFENS